MHSKIYLFLIFSVGLLLLIQCRFDGKTNIKTYYYPMYELYDGLTYEYRGISNEQLPPYYWYYRTVEQGESTYLTG
ncbi:MAG: hypothetical protein AAF599_09805, partial [Bacteroidota bacterium]